MPPLLSYSSTADELLRDRLLTPAMSAPFFAVVLSDAALPLEFNTPPQVQSDLGVTARLPKQPRSMPIIPLSSDMRTLVDTIHKEGRTDRLPWLEAAFPSALEDRPYVATPLCPEQAFQQMALDRNSCCNPQQPLPSGVEGLGKQQRRAPFRVAPRQMERDSELRALETLARDGIRLVNAQQLVFAHLARSFTNQVGSLSRAATDRTINVVSDLNHLVAEHFAKVTVRCVRSRRQNIARALNFSDTRELLAAPMGTDLFGGQWPKLHAEEQARKKATQEAQKLLRDPSLDEAVEEVTLRLTSSPFVQDRPFKATLVKASLVRASSDKASFFRAKSRLHRAPKSPQAQGLNPVMDEAEAGGVAVMQGGHETPARRGRSPPDPKGRVAGVAVEVPSDYPKDKTPSHRVGGRLLEFAAAWRSVTSDPWVLEVVSSGYCLEFTARPPPFRGVTRTPLPADPVQREALLQEIKSLVAKGAVVCHEGPGQEGFYSTFFLTTKKSGEWRPILNLKPLNHFICPSRFRMETLTAVIKVLQQGWWGATLDLRDPYLHVPVHKSSQKWLRFAVGHSHYQFRVLPFGLSTAPRTFTQVVKVVAEYLRRKGKSIFVYLDDWLLVAPSPQLLQSFLAEVIHLVQSLGFIVNMDKSSLVPSQSPLFLGATLDFRMALVRPSEARVLVVTSYANMILDKTSVTAQVWLRLLGLLASLIGMVPYCRLHMRRFQINLLSHYRPWFHNRSLMVPVPWSLLPDLRWWTVPHNVTVGVPFKAPPPSVTLTSDTSKSGWGAHLLTLKTAGCWSAAQSRHHINVLELWAIFLALRRWVPWVKGKTVLVRCDNMTVVTYINKEGGTRSPSLCRETLKLLKWCKDWDIKLMACHVPGVDNVLADALSRRGTQIKAPLKVRGSSVEWQLHRSVCHSIFQRLDRPHVDLFASARNHQLPAYYSWSPDPQALGQDAMMADWSGLLAYTFPPIAMIPRVLEKVAQSQNCMVMLVAPLWPRQLWFPRLLELLVEEPVRLPLRGDLVSGPPANPVVPERTIRSLSLTVWRISADSTLRRDFLNRLPRSLLRQGGCPLENLTILDSTVTMHGAPIERSIHFQQL